MKRKLTHKAAAFCREYVKNGYNATRAAIVAGYSKKTAGSIGHEILKKPEIQERIEHHKNHLEELLNISKSRVLSEHRKIAFSSIAHLHNTWIERKEFDQLTDDVVECIQEITSKVEKKPAATGEMITDELVRIRLYDKQKALDAIAKIMGYEAPSESNVNLKSEKGEIQALFPFSPPEE